MPEVGTEATSHQILLVCCPAQVLKHKGQKSCCLHSDVYVMKHLDMPSNKVHLACRPGHIDFLVSFRVCATTV